MSNHKIELLKDVSSLKGTAYIEFALGEYQEQHWQKTSVYLDAFEFDLIMGPFLKHVPNFDFFGFVTISAAQWQEIIADLLDLPHSLKNIASYQELKDLEMRVYLQSDAFQDSFEDSKKQFKIMIEDLTSWLEMQLKTHDSITFLGI